MPSRRATPNKPLLLEESSSEHHHRHLLKLFTCINALQPINADLSTLGNNGSAVTLTSGCFSNFLRCLKCEKAPPGASVGPKPHREEADNHRQWVWDYGGGKSVSIYTGQRKKDEMSLIFRINLGEKIEPRELLLKTFAYSWNDSSSHDVNMWEARESLEKAGRRDPVAILMYAFEAGWGKKDEKNGMTWDRVKSTYEEMLNGNYAAACRCAGLTRHHSGEGDKLGRLQTALRMRYLMLHENDPAAKCIPPSS